MQPISAANAFSTPAHATSNFIPQPLNSEVLQNQAATEPSMGQGQELTTEQGQKPQEDAFVSEKPKTSKEQAGKEFTTGNFLMGAAGIGAIAAGLFMLVPNLKNIIKR